MTLPVSFDIFSLAGFGSLDVDIYVPHPNATNCSDEFWMVFSIHEKSQGGGCQFRNLTYAPSIKAEYSEHTATPQLLDYLRDRLLDPDALHEFKKALDQLRAHVGPAEAAKYDFPDENMLKIFISLTDDETIWKIPLTV